MPSLTPTTARPVTAPGSRPWWQRPVVQFVAVGVVVAVVLALVTAWFGERIARDQAVDDARTTTRLLADTVIEPALSSGLLDTEASDLDKFDRIVRSRVLGSEIVRIKIWDADGRVVYSDEPRLIGSVFPLDGEQLDVLERGGSNAEVSDLARSENTFDQQLGRVLEVYTEVTAPSGDRLLFELYQSDDDLQQRTDELYRLFRPLTVGGLLVFLLLTVPLVWLVSRRADRAAADRERLLVMAAEASDAERRRVARDLHDGVVQDLAGTSFALAGLAREAREPRLGAELERLASAVRGSLLGLRSLLVEIYPPQLDAEGLGAALQDLVAPARQAGIDVELQVEGAERLSDHTTALIWRTAQECVRNAVRHAEPSRLQVSVAVTERPPRASLSVADDGRGFDADAVASHDRFGLRGLRDLAREAGGTLTVTSRPGGGTVVTLEVPVQ